MQKLTNHDDHKHKIGFQPKNQIIFVLFSSTFQSKANGQDVKVWENEKHSVEVGHVCRQNVAIYEKSPRKKKTKVVIQDVSKGPRSKADINCRKRNG